MDNKKVVYDFCPKCGALMKNGICTACGHNKEQQNMPATESIQGEQPPESVPLPALAPKKHRKFLIGACAGVTVFVVLLCAALYMIMSDIETAKTDLTAGLESVLEIFGGQEETKVDPDSGALEEDYVPQASDDFYVEIVDAVRRDLSYQIEWKECDVHSDQADVSFYTVYPQLTGDIVHKGELNAYISQEALFYKEYCELYVKEMGYTSCHIESNGYVTYMDEDTVSIVFQEVLNLDSTGIPGLFDINIDLNTGTVLEHDNMVSYTEELAGKFRRQNEYQNGDDLSGQEWTDEQLCQLLEDSSGVVFFTPVGLEIGFNYNGAGNVYGWVTVTLKDYEKYVKKI